MPYFNYTAVLGSNSIRFYWEVQDGGNKLVGPSSPCYKARYEKLPHSLKSCLDYCALLFGIYGYRSNDMEKERVIRLMVADGVIDRNDAENASCLEDIASTFIEELVGLGMLITVFDISYSIIMIQVPEAYKKLCIVDGDKDDFVARKSHSHIRVYLYLRDGTEISPYLEKLPIQSIFLYSYSNQLSEATVNTICGLQVLFVLEVSTCTWVSEILLQGVGKLVNLRFLCWNSLWSIKIPPRLHNLQHLQTLQIYSLYGAGAVEEVVHIKSLRHLEVSYWPCRLRLPKGVGGLVNLHTLIGWDVRTDTVGELSSLTQLRLLEVYSVGDNIIKLLGTISTMKKLRSLFMDAELVPYQDKKIQLFQFLEPFSPPPLFQELRLRGILMELPSWFASLENLTSLVLDHSSLTENPTLILQLLPMLKRLHLINACNEKLIGKDFCAVGGFPKLEMLEVKSNFLVEWTEIVVGAFPCLTFLDCDSQNLMFFPEGFQNISTLRTLKLVAHEDLRRRLNGNENYKIKHIPSVFINFY